MSLTKIVMMTADDEREFLALYLVGGDVQARNKVWLAHRPMATRAARAHVRHGKTLLEDLCQVALIALADAIDRFDLTRGTRLSSYAGSCIEFALRKYVIKQDTYSNVESCELSFDKSAPSIEGPENLVDVSIDMSRVMNRINEIILESYSGRDLNIAMALISDELVASVAERHGTSIERVRQIWRGVRLTLKGALQCDGLSGVDEISLGAETSSR
jgi:RNA polymerase sigma factor (sigma-70 family)